MATEKELEAGLNAACGVYLNDGRPLEMVLPADECERVVSAALTAAEQVRAQAESQFGDVIELQEAEQRGFERGLKYAEQARTKTSYGTDPTWPGPNAGKD